jgi:hypothetical protein
MWQSKNIFSYPATIFKEKSAKIAFLTQKYAQSLQNAWILAMHNAAGSHMPQCVIHLAFPII